MTVERYCRCGGGMRLTTSSVHLAADVDALFTGIHTGDEHGPATPAQATAARRRRHDEPSRLELAPPPEPNVFWPPTGADQ